MTERFDDFQKHLYLDLISKGSGRMDAARSLGFDPSTPARHMASDKDFKIAVEVAERLLVESVERVLADKALVDKDMAAVKMILERLDREKWGPESRLHVEGKTQVELILEGSDPRKALAELEALSAERSRAIQEVEAWRADEEDDNDG
jgi:hypothetical protein